MAHDVFVSHSSKDKPTADAVCAMLESQGIRCWIAPRDILPGKSWGESIVEAIKAARVMVLIFSANANKSPQIQREVERAINKSVPVIPLRIEDVVPTASLEYFLSTPHWLDAFTPPMEQHLQYLLRVVQQILEVPGGTAPPVEAATGPISPPPVRKKKVRTTKENAPTKAGSRRLWLVVGLLVGVVLVWAILFAKRPHLNLDPTTDSKTNSAPIIVSNALDPGQFLTWVSNHTEAAELLNFGTRFLEEGRLGQAIACYRRALELKPEDEEACFNLGLAYARGGQIAEAERYYREAIKLFPEYVEAHNNLGNLFTRQKRYADAAEEFNIALKLAPENASAHNNLGRALAEQGNAFEALKHFTESARRDTNYVEARFNMGAAYLVLGQTNEAIAAFRDALRLRPDFAPAAQALTRIKDVLR